VAQEAARFPNAEIVWCQEESKNMGAWSYVQPRIVTALRGTSKGNARTTVGARYVGRGPSASPATGSAKVHQEEQSQLVDGALRP
jgi:2-oxoglutarate dehydrogenase E1 component